LFVCTIESAAGGKMMRRAVLWLGLMAMLAAACAGVADTADEVSTTTTTSSAVVVTTTTAPDATVSTAPPTTAAPTTTRAPSGPGHGGLVVVADDQWPPTLNPLVAGGDNLIVSTIGQAHLAGAWDVDANTREIIPELVAEIPSLENGGVVVAENGKMTVSWQIREEAVWSDGEPITGDDFAFTVETVPEMSDGCAVIPFPEPPEFKVVEVGEKSITLEFGFPSVAYESFFRWVVPKHAVEGSNFCDDWNDTMWPAAGPFVIDEVVGSERVALRRNENYWKVDAATGEQLPWLDEVEFRFIPEIERIIAAFAAREVDVIQPPPWIDGLERLHALDGANVQVLAGAIWEHFNFQFGPDNRNEISMNNVAAYRRAIAYAIDLDAMNELSLFRGYFTPAYSFIDAFSPVATDEPWSQYRFDPDRARAELSNACDEAGRDCDADPPLVVFSTTANGDSRPAIAGELEVQLEAVGFEVELQLEDSQRFFGETLDRGTWDMGLWAWVGSPGAAPLVDIFRVFDPDGRPPDGDNYYRWGTRGTPTRDDEAVDRFRTLLAEMRATASRDRVFELARELETILAAEAVIIPIWSRLSVGAVWADEVGGFDHNPTSASHTWNIEHWYRVDR
jgi:peptide/nickel transport system substrate-binding protein